jgi:hypothetical protein
MSLLERRRCRRRRWRCTMERLEDADVEDVVDTGALRKL